MESLINGISDSMDSTEPLNRCEANVEGKMSQGSEKGISNMATMNLL